MDGSNIPEASGRAQHPLNPLKSWMTKINLVNNESLQSKIGKGFESFSNENLIPGFREIVLSKHVVIRVICIILILIGFGLTVYFMYGVTKEYIDEPTTMKIKQVRLNVYDFPQIYICLNDWVKKEGLIKRNLSQNGVTYLHSLTKDPVDYLNETEYVTAKRDFERFAESQNITLFAEAFILGSWDADDIKFLGSIGKSGESPLFAKAYFAGVQQVCYNVSFPAQSAAKLSIFTYQIMFDDPSASKANYFLAGADVQDFNNDDLQMIRVGHVYDVQITARKVTLFNRDESPCYETNDNQRLNYNQKACFARCVIDNLAKEYTCQPLGTGDKISNPTRKKEICSSLSNITKIYMPNVTNDNTIEYLEELRVQENAFTNCQEKCQEPCEKFFYDTVLVDKTLTMDDNFTTLSIKLEHAKNGITFIEETPSYTFVSAMSNIGGQLGLWMGLSIVTLFQVLFYFVNMCFEKR